MSVLLRTLLLTLVVVFIKMNTLGKTNSLIMESLNALFEYTTEGIIIANQSGTIVKAKYDMVGKSVIDQGTDALFEIL